MFAEIGVSEIGVSEIGVSMSASPDLILLETNQILLSAENNGAKPSMIE
ncbi:TPA: hypothetical protein P0E04_003772 [Vibrio campbellii]|nr:hypothetical protein [Vibrio campbellii]